MNNHGKDDTFGYSIVKKGEFQAIKANLRKAKERIVKLKRKQKGNMVELTTNKFATLVIQMRKLKLTTI